MIQKRRLVDSRFCAKELMQQHGVDFTETFTPVVRYDSLRVLLATVAREDFELLQFDIQTAFLYDELDEDIYMEIPQELNISQGSKQSAAESVVCKLNKAV